MPRKARCTAAQLLICGALLGNEFAVREYLANRLESAAALRGMIERDRPQGGIRQRLLARRQQASGA